MQPRVLFFFLSLIYLSRVWGWCVMSVSLSIARKLYQSIGISHMMCLQDMAMFLRTHGMLCY